MSNLLPQSSRRSFLRRSAIGAAGFSVVPASVLGLRGAVSPNSKLNLACIGVSGRGGSNLNDVRNENIVALCDVDTRNTDAQAVKHPAAKRYQDFRKMLEEMDRQIDGVVVSTPDHTHAVALVQSMKMGKHVYSEKPLAHSVHEIRTVMDVARKTKVATQLGNQGHSFDSIRAFKEWIEDGAIGPVREVHAMCGSVYSQMNQLEAVKAGQPVPPTLDWDLWLGPVPFRPYHRAYVPGRWRSWSAFGTGVIGDWVCHVIDPVKWALDLDAPSYVQAIDVGNWDPKLHGETFPAGSVIEFGFPAKGNRPAVTVTWYDGPKQPARPAEMEEGQRLPQIGALVVGEKAKIVYGSHGAGGLRIIPPEKMEGFQQSPKRIPKSPGHHEEWIQACKGGKPVGSTFEYGGPLAEIALLGAIAMRFKGQRLAWDSKSAQFAANPAANRYLRTEYRNGWSL